MSTVRLTMAQALVRYLMAQKTVIDGEKQPIFAGCWAIFGHGNVAGLGEALQPVQAEFPTYRGQNEQTMAHAAIAYAKTMDRKRFMAVTASAGPGSVNMVTASAVAHVNRLPLLFLPGDTFSTRQPDPVLQQVENPHDYTLTSNDAFKPVSRYFDRIHRPEQLMAALPNVMRVLTDPIDCGPAVLAIPQDVQTMAFDYPVSFFDEKIHYMRRQAPDTDELARALELVKAAKKPMVIAGGGIHYSGALNEFDQFVSKFQIPVAETQAGKGALPWNHAQNLGTMGVSGSASANAMAPETDLVIAVGTRLGDFASGSRALFHKDAKLVCINVGSFDAIKHKAQPLVGDAKLTLAQLTEALDGWSIDSDWIAKGEAERQAWLRVCDVAMSDRGTDLPTDAEVVGAVLRSSDMSKDIVACAAGGLPGELQKLWRTEHSKGYHMEYGYSCMGYEVAGGIGVKMAKPNSEVYVMVGDGSYMMANSEIFTSVMLGQKFILVVLDNRGYGCIHRLQTMGCGGAGFNNLLQDCVTANGAPAPKIDFTAHAVAMGAKGETVSTIKELEEALVRARASDTTYIVSIDTDPLITSPGGCWWEVAIPEVSGRTQVNEARVKYDEMKKRQLENL